MSEELTRVDSAVAGLSISPKDDKLEKLEKPEKVEKKTHKRVSSTAEGVRNINDLGKNLFFQSQSARLFSLNPDADQSAEKEGIKLEIAIETQKLNW